MLVKLAQVAKRPQVENTHFPCLVPYAGDSAPHSTQWSQHGLNHQQGCSCGGVHDSSCLPSTQNLLVLPYLPSRGRLGELQWLWKVTGTPAWSWMLRRETYFPSFCNFLCSEYSGCAFDHPSCSVPLLTLVAEQSSPLMESRQTPPFLFMQQCWKKACMSHFKGVLLLC